MVWARLDSRYAAKEKQSDLDFFVRTFVYGVVTYAVTFLIYLLLKKPFSLIDFRAAQDTTVLTRAVGFEILSATGVGFVLGIFWVYASTHKLLTRFLQLIGATKRYGDEDVWDYTFNSPAATVEYVHVRDFSQKLVYAGWVRAFSESGKVRELTLRDAQVFDFNGVMQYEVPLMYLARKPEDIHVEFPQPLTVKG